MTSMQLAYRSIKQREDNPGLLTFEEAFRVAKLIGKPIEDVVAVVIKELKQKMRDKAREEAAAKAGKKPGANANQDQTMTPLEDDSDEEKSTTEE